MGHAFYDQSRFRSSPHLLVFGTMPRGPLAILKETWCGENNLPPDVSKSTVEYLQDLRQKPEVAQAYSNKCFVREQTRHLHHYNKRTRPKSFVPGDTCLILKPESTASHALRRWQGPATVKQILSPCSYIVEYKGAKYRLHANLLRHYNIRVECINCFMLPYLNIM